MGARVVGDGGIVDGGSSATVLGGWAGGGCGCAVGAAVEVGSADGLTVASRTGTGAEVVFGTGCDRVGETGVDIGVASAGTTTCCAGRADWRSTTAVAAAAASVARTTPVRTIRRDHSLSSSGSASAWSLASWPPPCDLSASSGSNS